MHILAHLPDPSLIIDARTGRIVMDNPAFRAIVDQSGSGQPVRHFSELGFRALDARSPDVQPGMLLLAREPGLEIRNRELLLSLKDGSSIPVSLSVSSLSAPVDSASADRPGRVLVTFQKIDRLKQVEQAYRESEERHAFIVELMDAMRPLADAIEIQSTATRMLGAYLKADHALYTVMEADGDHYLIARDYHRPESRSLVGRYALSTSHQVYVQGLHSGKTLVTRNVFSELELTDQEREAYVVRELTAFVTVPLVKAGRLIAFLRVQFADVHDWTASEVELVEEVAERTWAAVERAQAEESVRRSELLLRTIIDSASDLLFIKDRESRIVLTNQAFGHQFGVDIREIIGKRVDAILPGEVDVKRAVQYDQLVMNTGCTHTREETWETPNGVRTFLISKSPWRDAAGEIVGVVGSAVDITGRKKAERQLRQQAQDLALADRNKSRFISVLSHELRNPLAAIMMALALMDHDGCREEQFKRAKEIASRQTAQLARLVDDLLDVTRINENKIGLKRESIDLAELVRRIVSDSQALFSEKGIRLESVLPPAPLYLDADPVRLTQAIGNLLHNARKFSRQGDAVSLHVRHDPDEAAAVVTVADTGSGIEPDVLERMFEPFTQADRSLDRTQGGLGLGLSIVKGLVELHGGRIEARSEGVGKGAQFIIRIPAAAERSDCHV